MHVLFLYPESGNMSGGSAPSAKVAGMHAALYSRNCLKQCLIDLIKSSSCDNNLTDNNTRVGNCFAAWSLLVNEMY